MVIDLIIKTLGARFLLAVAILLLMLCFFQDIVISKLAIRLDAAKAKNETQAVKLEAVGKQITAQNGAIDQLLANAAKAADRLHAAEAEAGKVRVVTTERIKYIEHSEIPLPCPEAVTWGTGHAIQIGKRWQAVTP